MCANDYAFAARSASGAVVAWGQSLRVLSPAASSFSPRSGVPKSSLKGLRSYCKVVKGIVRCFEMGVAHS